uniref:PtrPHT1-9 n=1 Tax=Arundo donax TaxID=35708 RepID=A0A0A9BFT4_ARUDO
MSFMTGAMQKRS